MKHEIRSMKSKTNSKSENSIIKQGRNDLPDRTLKFAKDIRSFTKLLPKSIANNEDIKQIVRSSGSVGANYLEVNESLSKKDFLMRVKISTKETRETIYWLELLEVPESLVPEKVRLLREATEIMNILGAILRKSE